MTSNFITFAVYKVAFSQGYDSNTLNAVEWEEKNRRKKGERKEEGKIIWEAVSFILNKTLLHINACHNLCSQW